MNSFVSAYRQLTAPEKAFVDAYVADVERQAQRANERISLALGRPIPPEVIDAAEGMLERPMVCAAITERITDIAAETELSPHRVVREYMAVAFSSMAHYMQVDEWGEPSFDLTKCTPEQLAALKSFEIETTGDGLTRARKVKYKFTLHDKMAGLDFLAKYMGLTLPENPHWRQDQARQKAALPADISTDGAADAYAAMING